MTAREWTTWATIGVFVVGSIVMAVAIDWQDLFRLLHVTPASTGEVAVRSNGRSGGRAGGQQPRAGQPEREGDESRSTGEAASPSPTPAESVRDLARKVDELPAPSGVNGTGGSENRQDAGQAVNSQASPAESTTPSLPPPVLRASGSSAIEIEWTEPPAGAKTGLVSINSYVPARVYIDGQYSGVTPRSVHLLVGDHSLRLVADGYQEWTRRIRVRNRQQVGVIAAMTRTPND